MTSHAAGESLARVRVALLRTPHRAEATVAELERRGAEVVLAPLIDWELPEDAAELDSRLRAASAYHWAIFTSATTVRACELRAGHLGTTLAALLGDVRVGAVGEATTRALEALGVVVDCVTVEDQSAIGLLAALLDAPTGTSPGELTRALLPQSSLAADTLSAGLAARGWSVDTVTAYATVDYPAREDFRIGEPGDHGPAAVNARATSEVMSREALGDAIGQGRIDAVVVSSPSIAERLRAMMDQVPANVAVIAIGRRTERDAAGLGLRVDAVAATPGPAGISDAVEAAVGRLRGTETATSRNE